MRELAVASVHIKSIAKRKRMQILDSIRYEAAPVKGGYTDRILQLDLSSLTISILKVEPNFKDKYVGGRGYAMKMIWDRTTKETRYDSPENILVMAGGPLCNEPRFPGTGKFVVGTISPLTDTFIDSNIGGHFAPLLKMCGFDALAVQGIADKEVVVIVDGDESTISIAQAPAYGGETDLGGLNYGEALLKEFNGGNLADNLAAVTTGSGAIHARFGIINSLFYDRRRGRL
ncbi:MAG: aldehyde ferredoxin oxidoreductase N-terminal domain-containing protein, partial [Syntrophobacterales bacterium]